MQNHPAERPAAITAKKRPKRPLIIRFFAGIGLLAQFLAKYLWYISRKNVPLALGLALFAGLFAAVAYNAAFHQSLIARPVLFSTRALPNADKAPPRPYIAKAISTEALENSRRSSAARPRKERQKTDDAIAAFIAAENKGAALKPLPASRAKPRAAAAMPDKKPVRRPVAAP